MYWDYNATVERNLINDWMQGVTPKVESLLSNYSVLIYNGQLDVILGAPLCLKALAKLQWPGAAAFAAAKKQIWHVAGTPTVAGYVIEAVSNDARRVGLTHATVRLAGHMVMTLSLVCHSFFAASHSHFATAGADRRARIRLRSGAALHYSQGLQLNAPFRKSSSTGFTASSNRTCEALPYSCGSAWG